MTRIHDGRIYNIDDIIGDSVFLSIIVEEDHLSVFTHWVAYEN